MTFIAGKAKQQQASDAALIRNFIDDVDGELVTTNADIGTVDAGLGQNATDRTAIGTATAGQVRDIVGRMLNRENAILAHEKHELQVKLRWLRVLRWLARRLLGQS